MTEDCVLARVCSPGCVVTGDPNFDLSGFTGPAADFIDSAVLGFSFNFIPVEFEAALARGEKIYVACGSGTSVLFFRPTADVFS